MKFRRKRGTEISTLEPRGEGESGDPWLGIPIYLDAGIAISLAASLDRGVALESSVSTAKEQNRRGSAKLSVSGTPILGGELGGNKNQSVAISESEVRRQTEESIFSSVRTSLRRLGHLNRVQDWRNGEWKVDEFVEFRTGTTIVPLAQVLSRVRSITEAFAISTNELSPAVLKEKIPRLLEEVSSSSEEDEDLDFEVFLSFVSEAGEISKALAVLISQIEEESLATGLVDIVMFEKRREEFTEDSDSGLLVAASLDREYVDAKLLRRLGQGQFGVVGKVIRPPAARTAFNAFRNSMLGSTNQLPVLLSSYMPFLMKFPLLLGDAANVGSELEPDYFDIVGTSSALAELTPLWVGPSAEVLPIAIYA